MGTNVPAEPNFACCELCTHAQRPATRANVRYYGYSVARARYDANDSFIRPVQEERLTAQTSCERQWYHALVPRAAARSTSTA